MKKALITLSALSLMAVSAQAALLAYEGFNYTHGTDVNITTLNTTGQGFSDAWQYDVGTQKINIEAEALAPYGSLSHVGNQWRRKDTGDESVIRNISADLDQGTELWFSMLFLGNAITNGGFGVTTGGFDSTIWSNGVPNFSAAGDSGFGFQVVGSNRVLKAVAWDEDGSRNISGPNYNLGITTHLLVVQIVFGTEGADDTVNIYDVGTDLTQGSVVSTVTGDVDEASLAAFAAGSKREYTMDEIRIGTSYADVIPVPEPSTYAMIAGMLALTSVMIRRR